MLSPCSKQETNTVEPDIQSTAASCHTCFPDDANIIGTSHVFSSQAFIAALKVACVTHLFSVTHALNFSKNLLCAISETSDDVHSPQVVPCPSKTPLTRKSSSCDSDFFP